MGGVRAHGSSWTLVIIRTLHMRTHRKKLFIIKLYGSNLPFPLLPFPFCECPSTLVCGPGCARGMHVACRVCMHWVAALCIINPFW